MKNNIEKFDEDFMFELTDDEVENLRSNFLTAKLNNKSSIIHLTIAKYYYVQNEFINDIGYQGMILIVCGFAIARK